MNSTKARDKSINLMNEEGQELMVDFLMQQLEIEDCNAHDKSLSQLDSSTSVNFAAKLQGMTVFTIVDFKKGYWMVVLHPDSRKLKCMVLPFGRFQWTRLPMGTFSNPSWIPSVLAWKVSQELLMTW